MIIKKKSPILILRINNFHSFNFIEEHSKVLKSVGDVWLLKTGKLIPEKALFPLRFQHVHQPHPVHSVTDFQFLVDTCRPTMWKNLASMFP